MPGNKRILRSHRAENSDSWPLRTQRRCDETVKMPQNMIDNPLPCKHIPVRSREVRESSPNSPASVTASGTAQATSVTSADLLLDRSEIEAVWNRGFDVNEHRFQCYLTNPNGKGDIWVFRSEVGEIRGAIGLHAQRMKIGEQSHPVGQIGNLAVDHEFRSAGPAVRLQRALLSSLPPSENALIFGATAKAVHILRRAGCRPVGNAQRWTKILRCEAKLRKFMRSDWLAKLVSPVLNIGLRVTSRETILRWPADVTAGIGNTFDSSFDRLWNRAASQFPIITDRSSGYLTWRFQTRDSAPYRVCWLRDSRQELAGYIVFQINPPGVAEIVDVFYDGPRTLDWLLTGFLRHVRLPELQVQTVSMNYFGSNFLGDKLRKFGFLRRPAETQILVSVNPAILGGAPAELWDSQNWYLTGADLDL